MPDEIIATLIASIVAIIASVFSLYISIKSIKAQKRMSNSSFQVEYLNKKLSLLDTSKKELTEIDHETTNRLTNQEKAVKEFAEYASKLLTIIPKVISQLEGHINDSKLETIRERIEKVKKLKAHETTIKLFGESKANEDFTAVQKEPLIYLFDTQKMLKDFIILEMKSCRISIEKVIEIKN